MPKELLFPDKEIKSNKPDVVVKDYKNVSYVSANR